MSVNWETAAYKATVFQAVLVVVSLGFILYQLRQQTQVISASNAQLQQQVELARAANSQTAVAQSAVLNSLFIQSGEVDKLWLRGTNGFKKGVKDQEVERDRYETLVDTYLTFYENLFVQHQKRLLDDDIYAVWDNDFKSFIEQSQLEKYWDAEKKNVYHPAFRDHVDELLGRNQSAPAR